MAENTATTQPQQPNVWTFQLRVMALTALLVATVYFLVGLPTDSKALTILLTAIMVVLVGALVASAVVFQNQLRAPVINSEKPATKPVAPAAKPPVEPARGNGGQQRPAKPVAA